MLKRQIMPRQPNYIYLVLIGFKFRIMDHAEMCVLNILDLWLGDILPESERPEEGAGSFTAIISASEELTQDHPRKVVIRGCIHRGAKVVSTEGEYTHKL